MTRVIPSSRTSFLQKHWIMSGHIQTLWSHHSMFLFDKRLICLFTYFTSIYLFYLSLTYTHILLHTSYSTLWRLSTPSSWPLLGLLLFEPTEDIANSSKTLHTRQLADSLDRDFCFGALKWGQRKAKLSSGMPFWLQRLPLIPCKQKATLKGSLVNHPGVLTLLWHNGQCYSQLFLKYTFDFDSDTAWNYVFLIVKH